MQKSDINCNAEFAYTKPGGESGYLSIAINPIINEGGGLNGFLLHGNDITGKRKSEAKLRLASTVYEYALDGIMVTDGDVVIQSVNPAFTTITGYLADEAIGKNPRLLNSDRHNDDFYKEMWASLNERGLWKGEIWNRRKNGEVYPEWLALSAIKDSSGNTTEYISVFRDISEIKRAEEELRKQSERLLLISREPSGFFTSQVHPEPKVVTAVVEKVSLNLSKDPKARFMASPKSPEGPPLHQG